MKVLMVTGAYFPELSGAGLQCRTLIRALGGIFDFEVLTTSGLLSTPDSSVDGVPVHRVYVEPRRLFSLAAAGLKMIRYWSSRRRDIGIVHLHGFSMKTMLIIVLAKLSGKPIVLKLTSVGHDDPVSAGRWGTLARLCYRLPDKMVGISPQFKLLAGKAAVPPERFMLIPNGVALDRFRPGDSDERLRLRAELGLPVDRPIVLFVGFFSHDKCPKLLFDAWRLALERGAPTSTVVFIGAQSSRYYEVDSSLAGSIRTEAAFRGLGSSLMFVERTETIEEYYRCSDIFVLPSSREGHPNALLEAMASGMACIAANLPGVTDSMITDRRDGRLVPSGDADELASALGELLSHPDLRERLGREARCRVEAQFPISKTAELYRCLYHELRMGLGKAALGSAERTAP